MASYRVEVSGEARSEIRQLPGYMRQRVLRLLQDLRSDPRPHNSSSLDTSDLALPIRVDAELRRIRLEKWRVVYLLDEEAQLVSVLAVRKRPPYRYDDLDELLHDQE